MSTFSKEDREACSEEAILLGAMETMAIAKSQDDKIDLLAAFTAKQLSGACYITIHLYDQMDMVHTRLAELEKLVVSQQDKIRELESGR